MLQSLEKKILYVREQPEAVRMRYLFACLGVSMIFVFLIWIFSLKESASEIAKTKITVPQNQLQSDGKSLQSLINSDLPLRIKNENQTENQNPVDQKEAEQGEVTPNQNQ